MVLLISMRPLAAQTKTERGKITYLSGESCFSDVGKDKGAAIGDTLFSESRKPILVIQSISRKSSFCAPIQPVQKIETGMTVLFYPKIAVVEKKITVSSRKDTITHSDPRIFWSGVVLTKSDSSQRPEIPFNRPAVRKTNQLVGRIAFQSIAMKDQVTPFNNYGQGGGVLNFHIYRIQDSPYEISANMLFRKTYAHRTLPSNQYPLRIYEISVAYNNPASPYRYAVGRIFSPEINGVGNFDGGLLSYQASSKWSMGAFGGTQPNYLNSKPDLKNEKMGFYARYENGTSPERRWTSTVAFAGQYVHGKIDREYIYLQQDAAIGPRLYMYANSEIGINRSNSSTRKHTVELSNVYVLGRYKPVTPLTISLSYDARINVFLIQTYRAIPDSLFDDALRQGIRGDVNWRALKQLTLSASSSVRTRAGDPNKTYLHSAGVYYFNLLQSGTNIAYNLFYAATTFTKAISSSYGLSRQFADLYLTGTFRTYDYTYTNRNPKYHRNSITVDASYALGRKIYVTGEYERSAGKDEKSDRFFMELTYRF